ncbi:MAG: peptidase [Vulcanococcus sp.]
MSLPAPNPEPPAPAPRTAARRGPALRQRLRQAHAALAPWVLAPLLLKVCTGLGYRLLRDWGGPSRDQAHRLMALHEGEWLRQWLGPQGETLYVLVNGLGLLWMLGSGAALLVQRLRRPQRGEKAEAGG